MNLMTYICSSIQLKLSKCTIHYLVSTIVVFVTKESTLKTVEDSVIVGG